MDNIEKEVDVDVDKNDNFDKTDVTNVTRLTDILNNNTENIYRNHSNSNESVE